MALSQQSKAAIKAAITDGSAAKAVLKAAEAGLVQAAAVASIADTVQADAEECAEKINELLASLRAAGILASS